MKKVELLFLILFVLTFFSCEEDFNPYGDYQEKFAFTCILKNNDNFQTATLFKSYLTPPSDPAVTGADIRVWYNDSVFVFRDTSVARTDTSHYKSPFRFYYNKDFSIGNKKPIELEVLLPNGKRLRSASMTPEALTFSNESALSIPTPSSNILYFEWNSFEQGTYFLPKLVIRYNQNIDGEIVEKTIVVPAEYVEVNGELTAVYPSPISAPIYIYQLDAVTKALQQVSAGDPNKSNYSVYQKLSLSVIAYDAPVSKYVSSIGGSIDDLTVSVDVPDYSNIQGGFGLFGSYIKKNYTKLKFLQNYIESFGYNFIIENND